MELQPGVYFIGAGPGDPDLLTLRASRILAAADTILYADSLIPKAILQGARSDAEIVATKDKTLEEILAIAINRARQGKSVARLQSGDLTLYSAVGEQARALRAADVPYEMVPGIGAFQAAAATLGVELTVPGRVQTILLARASGRTEVPAAEELSSLAAHRASLCLYLSARHIEAAQEKILQHYPPETPAAVCYRVGWQDEKIWVVPLREMAAVTRREKLIRTTLYVVSPALGEAETRSRLYHPEHDHLFRSPSDES